VAPRRLEQVERAVRVHREVDLRRARGPVVRRLRRRVHDELELPREHREHAHHARLVADVDVERGELPMRALEAIGLALGRRRGAEELRAHVVVEAHDVEARLDERADGLRADEPARAGDDRRPHASVVGSRALRV
jgi:hypothetical protein